MRSLLLLLLLCLFLVSPIVAGAGRPATESPLAVVAANQLLKAEYDLARKPQIYFVVDLPASRFRFKASGITVTDLTIAGHRLWGPVPASTPKPRTVEQKEALFAPQRQKIEAPKVTAGKDERPFKIKALELGDMPTAFRARFDDGTRLSVRAVPEGFMARGWSTVQTGLWYFTRPLISDWHFLFGTAYTELHLTLPARDVQLLYWSLTEGSSCLIDWPRSGAEAG